MDSRPVRWDGSNRRKFSGSGKTPSVDEVEQAMTDPGRTEAARGAERGHLVGRTAGGRWLYVTWAVRKGGRYPKEARRASPGDIVKLWF